MKERYSAKFKSTFQYREIKMRRKRRVRLRLQIAAAKGYIRE